MEHDGGSGNDSSPDTVLARSSSEEDRGRKLESTSGEYVTVAESSSSLDTPTSVGAGGGVTGVAPSVAHPALSEDKKKRRFAILKGSFRKDGGIFGTRKKSQPPEDPTLAEVEDPESKEKDWSGKLERQQREDERSEGANSKKKKKKKSQSLVRKLSFNKFRLSTQHEARRAPEGGDSSRSQSQSSQESTSHSDSPSKLSRKGSDREEIARGNRGERQWESPGGREQLEKTIEKAIERPISSVVVVQRRSPSLTIRSIPKNPEHETSQERNAEDTRRCTSTLPYAISKWADRPSGSTFDAPRKTKLSTKADSESALGGKTSPLELRRKLSLLEEKRAIFQRRPLDSSQETDSGETVIAVSVDEDTFPETATEKRAQEEARENVSTRRKARHISVRKFDTFSTFEGTFDEDTGLGYLAGIEEDYTESYDRQTDAATVTSTAAISAAAAAAAAAAATATVAASVATMSPTVGNSNDAGATTSTDKARSMSQESVSSQNNAPNVGVIEKREHLYKILVIGELGAGKTSIIKRYVHQFFSQNYRATIGVDFALKVLNWDPHTIIRLQLWDIAGQERFGNMTRVYYKEAVGAFIVFDVTRSATLDAVVKWKQDLDSKVQLPDGSPIPCVLLANKCDQQKEGLVNSPAKMDEYCKEKNFVGWFETSAKENINIEEAARFLVSKILQNDQKMRGNGTQDQNDGERFALNQPPATSKKSCSC